MDVLVLKRKLAPMNIVRTTGEDCAFRNQKHKLLDSFVVIHCFRHHYQNVPYPT